MNFCCTSLCRLERKRKRERERASENLSLVLWYRDQSKDENAMRATGIRVEGGLRDLSVALAHLEEFFRLLTNVGLNTFLKNRQPENRRPGGEERLTVQFATGFCVRSFTKTLPF
jgi:hypothetical protein